MDIFPVHQKHLLGILIFSNIEKGKILNIDIPKMDDSFFVLTASDMGITNRIRIMETYIPLLAKEDVEYLGQPVVALFGFNYKKLTEYAEQFRISYKINNNEEPEKELNPFTWSHGMPKEVFEQPGIEVYSSSYTSKEVIENPLLMNTITAEEKNGFVHIDVTTRWPFNIKNIVASVLGIPKNKVIVEQKEIYPSHKESQADTVLYSSYAAVAAMKTGKPVKMIYPESVIKPEIKIQRKTAVNRETERPLAEQIEVDVNLGIYPFFSSEICKCLVAGLIPPYQLRALSVEIRFNKNSSKRPSAFFGDLGYSSAVISTETHFNRIAEKMEKNPYKWKMEHLGVNNLQDNIMKYANFSIVQEISKYVTDKSGFIRKYGVYGMNSDHMFLLNPFVNYNRGVGFALSPGITGFSRGFQYQSKYYIELIMQNPQEAMINTSFKADSNQREWWMDIVAEHLNLRKVNISIIGQEDSRLADSGPEVLNRENSAMPLLLIKACDAVLKRKVGVTDFPLSETAYLEKDDNFIGYDSSSWGAVVVELYIDPYKLVPIISSVYSCFSLPSIRNRRDLEIIIKHKILNALKKNGVLLGRHFLNDFTLIDRQEKGVFSFPEIEGVISSALLSALEQTQEKNVLKLPFSSDELLKGEINEN